MTINRIKAIFHYYLLSKSGLFDPGYYLKTYPDVRRADINPLWHFVRWGWKENRNPSDNFITNIYLNNCPDVKNSGINPLIHYLKFGKKEGRCPDKVVSKIISEENQSSIIPVVTSNIDDNKTKRVSDEQYYNNAKVISLSDIVDIIICVGSKTENVRACLSSIRKNTKEGSYSINIVIHNKDINNISDILTSDVKIHLHDMDLFNYSHANNLAIKETQNDVVLLNDDTEVTEGWLTKLRKASKGFALTGAHTGKQCSGNPQMWGEGPVRLTNFPINMFCAYIPRRIIDVVGLLDEEFVYYGGEDVDYSCRALMNGFPLVISDAFIIHKNNQTFGETKEILMKESSKIILEKYGLSAPFDLDGIRPNVSAIIATRNRPELLKAAINSVMNVGYENFELFIIDDYSSHETNAVILEAQEKYKNIFFIRVSTNLGSTKARRIGLHASSGQFIFITDDDDTVLSNRISAPLDYLRLHPNLDVVYCNYNLVTDGLTQNPVYCKPFEYQAYLNQEFNIGAGILLGRRNVFTTVPFQTTYDRAVDYDWVFRVSRAGYKIDLCPEIVMNYNRSGSVSNHLSGNAEAINKHKEIFQREVLLEKMKRH